MKISNSGLVELVGHEGVCLSKYKDSVGVWTIGIGATKTEIPDLASWPLDKKITMQQAFDLLKKGIVKYEDALNTFLTVPIKQTEFDALCSWCYNVGVGWVPKASVIRLINNGQSGQILFDALMMYQKPKEIINRRRKEAVLLREGKYSNQGIGLLFPVSDRGYPVYAKGKPINVWEYLGEGNQAQPVPEVVTKEDNNLATPSWLDLAKAILNKLLERK
jgi:lysozyme